MLNSFQDSLIEHLPNNQLSSTAYDWDNIDKIINMSRSIRVPTNNTLLTFPKPAHLRELLGPSNALGQLSLFKSDNEIKPPSTVHSAPTKKHQAKKSILDVSASNANDLFKQNRNDRHKLVANTYKSLSKK
jgi:hypothetical protein